MPTFSKTQPSFTPHRKWSIGFNVILIILLVFSVVGMVNYLSRDYFYRVYWSSRSKVELSPLTIKFVKSVTNTVKATVYYDKNEALYGTIVSLLNEYRLINPKITVETVDYLRDPATAQKIKEQYKLGSVNDRNLIIFDCEGRLFPVPGDAIAKYVSEQVPNEKQPEFRRKPTDFFGEKWFTSAILYVTNPKPLIAYMVKGHQEHGIESVEPNYGYAKFAALLAQYRIGVLPLSLTGTNPVPADCHLMIIAGPQSAFFPEELEKIDQYLTQGGRLFALFRRESSGKDTGLEAVLAKWGIDVGHNVIVDPENTAYGCLLVGDFGPHPVVNPLMHSSLALINPRSVGKLKTTAQAAEALRVEEIARTGPKAFAKTDGSAQPRSFPLIVAAEKAAPRGVITERGSCRIIAVGDSIFLANTPIDSVFNRDFAGYAVNWLLNRTQLLEELGPRPIAEYKLVMSRIQVQRIQWLLLAVMPGIVLLFGSLVWLRRRR